MDNAGGDVGQMPSLPSWKVMLGLAAVTLVLANVIATFMARLRLRRVQRRTERLKRAHGARVPVTLVTGFLGAGKTTLLNHILRSQTHGKRVAVIENEVGSISIDHDLLRRGDEGNPADGVFVLKNGCVCCLTSGSASELEKVLETLCTLLDQPKFQYDYVVVESSGLADPSPIIQTFFRTALAKSKFFMDGVVTVVDAKNISMHLQHTSGRARTKEAERQVAYADVIVLNKTDTVTQQQLAQAEALVQDVNATATLLRAVQCQVDVEGLLDIQAFSESSIPSRVLHAVQHHDHHEHTPEVSAVSVSTEGRAALQVDLPKFQAWIKAMLQERWRDLFRIKGILAVRGFPKQFVVQGAHADFVGELGAPWPQGEPRVSRLVFIGRHLDQAKLQGDFDACLA